MLATTSTLSIAGVTVASPGEAGIRLEGGADHSLATTGVSGAGTYGMECLNTPLFTSCATDVTMEGALGTHSGCDTCATEAGF